MAGRLSDLGGSLRAAWDAMPLGQRLTVTMLATGMLGGILLLGAWSGSPDYEAAFTGLNEESAAKIVAHLREKNLPYQLAANGRSIAVPPDRVAEARLQVAEAGLAPKGQAGFELFNQPSFGLTDQMQRVNYQRALEGELGRTIKRMDGVEDARVHLVLGTTSVFADKRSEASASVVLSPRAGRLMDEERVQAVLDLVVGSVEGLKAQNVSIVDTKGRILNSLESLRAGGASGARANTSQYQLQRRHETDLAAGLTSAMERVVGPGKATVRVSAQFNWDQVETQRESYEPGPGSGAIRSQREQQESANAPGGAAAGGVPGTASNASTIPTYQTGTGSAPSGSERRETVTNYEVGKTVQRTVKSSGTPSRVSVMVLLDQQNLPGGVTVESLEKLVEAAGNLDRSRGDSVVISVAPFTTTHLEEAAKAMEEAQQREMIFTIARNAGVLVVPMVLLFFLRRVLQRASSAATGHPVALSSGSRPLAIPPPLPPLVEDPTVAMTKERVLGLARQEPKMVSAVISTWLDEGRR